MAPRRCIRNRFAHGRSTHSNFYAACGSHSHFYAACTSRHESSMNPKALKIATLPAEGGIRHHH